MNLTHQRLKELVIYDPDTGIMTWRIGPPRKGFLVGQPIGWISKGGYYRTKIDGKAYAVHRLAWLYMTGEPPPKMLDHANGNPRDNRWENLRPATYSQNGANSLQRKRNTSGFKGVTWHEGGKKWWARICVNGKYKSLGLHGTKEGAAEAYRNAAIRIFGQYARFTDA